jgi:hypothetical protein
MAIKLNAKYRIWLDSVLLLYTVPQKNSFDTHLRIIFFHTYVSILHEDVLGGVMISVLAIGPKVRGFNPGRGQWIFNGDKNPQHAFRRIGSKVVGPISFSFTACLRSLRSLNKYTSLGQIRFLRQFLLLYYYMTAGRIDREHWWTSH